MRRLRGFGVIRVWLSVLGMAMMVLVTLAIRAWSTPALAAGGSSVANDIVGDWLGERLIPMSQPSRFVRNTNVFVRFTPYGRVIMRLDGPLGTRQYECEYEVSGQTVVIAGGIASSNTSFSAVLYDVGVENNQLRFVMQPSPVPFTQDDFVGLFTLNKL